MRDFTEKEIQNVRSATAFLLQIKEKIELRKELERSCIEYAKKHDPLTAEKYGKFEAAQIKALNKKYYIAGA